MTLRAITPGSVTRVTGLTERPVFFVTLQNEQQPCLVVKGENKAGNADEVKASVTWASKMMKNVNDPLVKSKPLLPEEWTVFKKFAVVNFAPNSPQSRNLTAANYVWVKMPYVPNLTDADFVNADATTNEKAVKEVLAMFLREETWRELGKVVAVDLFISNFDRFMLNLNGQVSWGNRGNIMFQGRRVIGLDPYFADQGGPAGDANLNNVQLSPLVMKGLDYLKIPVLQQGFAAACVHAVAGELHSRMGSKTQGQGERRREVRGEMQYLTIRTEDPQNPIVRIEHAQVLNLFDPFIEVFQQGLALGAQELKTYLVAKRRKYAGLAVGSHRTGLPPKTLPAGVLARMQYCGWNI